MDKELEVVAAETLALQSLLAHILDQLRRSSPKLDRAIREGFDHAASECEALSIQFAKTDDGKKFVKALGIIEYVRTATFGDQK